MLVCHWCEIALTPKAMLSHLHGTIHSGAAHLSVNDSLFQEAISNFYLAEQTPPIPTMIVSAVFGLSVHSGFKCSHCSYVAKSSNTIKNHFYQTHPGISKPKSWSSCFVQRFSASHSNHWFEVTTSSSSLTTKDTQAHTIDLLINNFKSQKYEQSIVDDNRMINPWLLSTHWHEYTSTQDPAILHAIVDIKEEIEFHELGKLVLEHINDLGATTPLVNTLIRQYINTDDIKLP